MIRIKKDPEQLTVLPPPASSFVRSSGGSLRPGPGPHLPPASSRRSAAGHAAQRRVLAGCWRVRRAAWKRDALLFTGSATEKGKSKGRPCPPQPTQPRRGVPAATPCAGLRLRGSAPIAAPAPRRLPTPPRADKQRETCRGCTEVHRYAGCSSAWSEGEPLRYFFLD